MHRVDRFNLQSIKRGFNNWPITLATYLSSPPTPPSEIMTTGKIHLSAHCYQYCAPYPARMRVLSRVAMHRRKNERRDKSSGSRSHDRASVKIQGGTSVSVKFTTNIFLLPPKTGSNLHVASPPPNTRLAAASSERKTREGRGYISVPHTRVSAILSETTPKKLLVREADPAASRSHLFLQAARRDPPISQKRNSTRDGLFGLISRRNFGFV